MNAHELEGVALDAAVLRLEDARKPRAWPMVRDHRGELIPMFRPSQDWADGGPIIERERIAIYFADESPRTTEPWVAGFCLEIDQGQDWGGDTGPDSASLSLDYSQTGPTPLIAAMRAYVAMMASTRKLEGVD